MVEYTSQKKFNKHSGERYNPKEFKEIWKDVSLRLILEDKGGKQHCLPISWFWTWGWDIFEKEGTSKKGCVKIEDWGFSVHFVLGFPENYIYTLHFCFRSDITKWCKIDIKTDSRFQKPHEGFGKLYTSSEKFIRLNLMGYFCPKTAFVQKIHSFS